MFNFNVTFKFYFNFFSENPKSSLSNGLLSIIDEMERERYPEVSKFGHVGCLTGMKIKLETSSDQQAPRAVLFRQSSHDSIDGQYQVSGSGGSPQNPEIENLGPVEMSEASSTVEEEKCEMLTENLIRIAEELAEQE